ncbi:hypothetical protein HU200_030737 [Digitaria exilis]|uniref:Uncharacterized protein n=1 Tax=Digitaria exilis TaxID=1010633 RepID=A0A835EQL1_9POAL|nr:hypothetical protein HU200_030737 [Digitaria exilis]
MNFRLDVQKKKQWRSHSSIDPTTKDLVLRLRDNNISIGRICSILGVSGGIARSTLRKESIRSLCSKISRENMRDDIGKTLELLDKMKEADPAMAVKFQLDKQGCIRTLLWCTGKTVCPTRGLEMQLHLTQHIGPTSIACHLGCSSE